MGKYDNVTVKQFFGKLKELMDDNGRINKLCTGISCRKCKLRFEKGCLFTDLDEYDKLLEVVMGYEPSIDWGNVPIDTKILVRDNKSDPWKRRYFAGYNHNKVSAYKDGLTSFTESEFYYWNYAKLYKEGEDE